MNDANCICEDAIFFKYNSSSNHEIDYPHTDTHTWTTHSLTPNSTFLILIDLNRYFECKKADLAFKNPVLYGKKYVFKYRTANNNNIQKKNE